MTATVAVAASHRRRSGRRSGGNESSDTSMTLPQVTEGPAAGGGKGHLPDDRQIVASVRYGRRCTFFPMDNDAVTGYVGGIERFNYVVHVVTNDRIITELIHKSCPRVRLHSENTYDDEPLKAELDKIMGSFRRRVLSGHLG